MKPKKKSVLFLFLCLMSAFLLSVPVSDSLFSNDGIVYADEPDDEDEGDEEEVEEEPAPDTQSGGDYSQFSIPSRLATAYADGLRGAQQGSEEDMDQFSSNMETLINNADPAGAIPFDTIGLLMGPVSQSSGSGTNDVSDTLSMSLEQLERHYNFDHAGEAYWTFGHATQNLIDDAEGADHRSIATNDTVGALAGVSNQVANMGIRLLNDWSPAPVVLAFMDNTVLYDASYSSNRLLALIHDVEVAFNLVNFFGSPVPMVPQLSYAQMLLLTTLLFSLGISILTVFTGDRFFKTTVKKTAVRVAVAVIAVPLTMQLYDQGLTFLEDVAGEEVQSGDYQKARNHLLLGLWAEQGFSLPASETLQTRDDRFLLSREQIRAINGHVLGVDADDHAAVAEAIDRYSNNNNNTTEIAWQTVVTRDGNRAGELWLTGALDDMAYAIGSNEPIEDHVDANMADNAIGYVYGSGLRATRNDSGFTYSQRGAHSAYNPYTRFGLSPIATYNLLNTSFTTNGLNVRDNMPRSASLPSVAPSAYSYAFSSEIQEEDRDMPYLVRWIVQFTLMVASVKALAKIISSGFGGLVHGGARATFGSSSGWGELLGAIFASIFGVIGLSLFALLAMQVVNGMYGMIHAMIVDIVPLAEIGEGVERSISNFLGPVREIPWVGDILVDTFSGIFNAIANLLSIFLSLFFLPKIVKVPIEAFATWISSLPQTLAQKAQNIENRFTGDHLAGGSSTGAWSGAAANAGSGMLNSSAAVMAGTGLVGGAATKAAGGLAWKGAKAVGGKIGGKGKDGANSATGDPKGKDGEKQDENAKDGKEGNNEQNVNNEELKVQEGENNEGDVEEGGNNEGDATNEGNQDGDVNDTNENEESVQDSENTEVEGSNLEGNNLNDTQMDEESSEESTNEEHSAENTANDEGNQVEGNQVNDTEETNASVNENTNESAEVDNETGDIEGANVEGSDVEGNAVEGAEVNENASEEQSVNESVADETSVNEEGNAVEQSVNEEGNVSEQSNNESTDVGGNELNNTQTSEEANNQNQSVNESTNESNETSNEGNVSENVNNNAKANVEQSAHEQSVNQEGNQDNRQNANLNRQSKDVNNVKTGGTGENGKASTNGKAPSTNPQGKTSVNGTSPQNGKQQATNSGKQQATNSGKQQATNSGKQQATNSGKQQATNSGKQKQGENQQKTNNETKDTAKNQSVNESTNKSNETSGGNQKQGENQQKTNNETKDTANNDQAKNGQNDTTGRSNRLVSGFKTAARGTRKVAGNYTGKTKGEVSNREQAAVGAAHIIGGLSGAEKFTQKGVDNVKRRQGKEVENNSNNDANTNAQNADPAKQQQIMDQERQADEKDKKRKVSVWKTLDRNNK